MYWKSIIKKQQLEKEDFELQEAMIKAPCASTTLLAKLTIILCTVLHQLDREII